MDKILLELNIIPSLITRFRLIAMFVVSVAFFVLAGYGIAMICRCSPIIVHISIWFLWFLWQGYFFPHNRESYIKANPQTAYRQAFYRDILFGVTIGVAQMVRPTTYFIFYPQAFHYSFINILLGAFILLTGIYMLYAGFSTIGFDGAGFLYEYRREEPKLVVNSIYSYIRHPLFLGGVLASFGSTIITGNPNGIFMAMINVIFLPIYSYIEDRRLVSVFGAFYTSYINEVGAIIPKFRTGIWKLDSSSKQEDLLD